MAAEALEFVLRRDRAIVAASLAGITLLAWAYLFWLAHSMNSSDMTSMPDMPGMDMAAPAFHEWSAGDFGFTFAMWAVMMVGMMTPSAAPMILVHARVARQAAVLGKPLAATGWFAAGYLFSWAAFSMAATLLEGALEQAALMAPMSALSSAKIGGIVLVVAGFYQWTPLKDACLRRCRAPLHFIQQHGGFRKDPSGSFTLGLRHGLYCIGCCWALMALLFAGGVMNIAWIAALSAFVLVEKIASARAKIAIASGAILTGAGLWMLVRG